jgi:uncharacterized OB-fold protein
MTSDSKLRGRPKGQPNNEYAEIIEVKTRCPKCSMTEFTPERFVRHCAHNGIAPDGKPYTKINIVAKRCISCGQATLVKKYFNEK